jgi:hypothetical protein
LYQYTSLGTKEKSIQLESKNREKLARAGTVMQGSTSDAASVELLDSTKVRE